jgi:hypothetical protein
MSSDAVVGAGVEHEELTIRRGQRRPLRCLGPAQWHGGGPGPGHEWLRDPLQWCRGDDAWIRGDQVETQAAEQVNPSCDGPRLEVHVRIEEDEHRAGGLFREPRARPGLAEPTVGW